MPHSFAQIYLHAVFSTKARRNLIPKEIQPKLWAYLVGIGRNIGASVSAVGGTQNHAHLLLRLPAVLPWVSCVALTGLGDLRDRSATQDSRPGLGCFAPQGGAETETILAGGTSMARMRLAFIHYDGRE